MEDNTLSIERLNKFLKGIHMGATTFKDYLDKAESSELKEVLVKIIESFKKHEEAITHRIEDMGGDAADSIGIGGMFGEFFEKLKLMMVDSDKEIIEKAINAIDMGIEQGKKFIDENKELPNTLMSDVKGVFKDYDNHLRELQNLQSKMV